jgi:hypothetical protein
MAKKCEEMKAVEIYLESWQQRMVKDFLGVDCESWTIPLTGNEGIRYKPPVTVVPNKGPRMYFTDWQRRLIKNATGCTCNFTELLRKGDLVKYRIPPERLTREIVDAAKARGASTFLIQK